MGIQVEVENSKKLAESLDKATRPGEPYFNKLLRILSTRYAHGNWCMRIRAKGNFQTNRSGERR